MVVLFSSFPESKFHVIPTSTLAVPETPLNHITEEAEGDRLGKAAGGFYGSLCHPQTDGEQPQLL